MWFQKAAEEFEENRSDEKGKWFSILNWPEWNQWKAGSLRRKLQQSKKGL